MGPAWFRVLSYYFGIRWSTPAIGQYIRHVLGVFEVSEDPDEGREPPIPDLPPVYSISERGERRTAPFLLEYGNHALVASNDTEHLLSYLFWHVNSEAARRTGDFLLIHAGAVATPADQGVVIPGISGGGKSTLVAALVRAGFSYLSDEIAAIDPVGGKLHPFPKALTLKNGWLFDHYPDLRLRSPFAMQSERHLHPDDIRPGSIGGPVHVEHVIFYSYRTGEETRLTPLSPAETVTELGNYAMNLRLYRARAMPLLSAIARRSNGHRLVSGDLDRAVQVITKLACL